MDESINIKSFPITVYGDLTPYNEVISKARCRIFYKGANRNGTYITDAFAEKLLKTIPYTPVKGIYDGEDYTDHGHSRQLGRIYGIVPENPNLSWEMHDDEDGVQREYACVDVYLFTTLYAEAGDIVGKAQSMELYDKSIEGIWAMYDGQKYYEFTNACFLGLQVLGDEVKPCFEGAAFFSLYESLSNMIKKIEEYNFSLSNNKQGGTDTMSIVNYRLSDNDKLISLWNLLNEHYTEEEGWIVDYEICEVYDDYALVRNCGEKCFERVYYEKNDEDNSVHVCGKKKAYVIDVTEEEMAALNAIKMINEGSFADIDKLYTDASAQVESLTQEKAEFEQKIEEYTVKISTLETEKEEINTQYESANSLLNETKETLESVQANLATLQSEHDTLVEYKKAVEKSEKEGIIASYAEMLSDELLASYTEKIEQFTAVELDKELAYELKKANVNVFSKSSETKFVPKDNIPKSGLEEILSRYQNNFDGGIKNGCKTYCP